MPRKSWKWWLKNHNRQVKLWDFPPYEGRTWPMHPNFIAHLMFGFWGQDYVKNHWMVAAVFSSWLESLSGFGPDRRVITGCNNIPISQLESPHPLSVCSVVYPFMYLFIGSFWLIVNFVICQSHLILTLKAPVFAIRTSLLNCIFTYLHFYNVISFIINFHLFIHSFYSFVGLLLWPFCLYKCTSFNWVLGLFVQGIWVMIYYFFIIKKKIITLYWDVFITWLFDICFYGVLCVWLSFSAFDKDSLGGIRFHLLLS